MSRPIGPADAAASPPILTLLLRIDLALRSFITRKRKSVACPPSWNPKLKPSRAIMDGAPQSPFLTSLPRKATISFGNSLQSLHRMLLACDECEALGREAAQEATRDGCQVAR